MRRKKIKGQLVTSKDNPDGYRAGSIFFRNNNLNE